jgi:hypothetical protein
MQDGRVEAPTGSGGASVAGASAGSAGGLEGRAGTSGVANGGTAGALPLPPSEALPLRFDDDQELDRCKASGASLSFVRDGAKAPYGSAQVTRAGNAEKYFFHARLRPAVSLVGKRLLIRARADVPVTVKAWASSTGYTGGWADSGPVPVGPTWTVVTFLPRQAAYVEAGWRPDIVKEAGLEVMGGAFVLVDEMWVEEGATSGEGGSAGAPAQPNL